MKHLKKSTQIILGALILLLSFIIAEIVRSPDTDEVSIYFLNVGQGDSALIQRGDYQILIDGGPDEKVLSELGYVMPAYDREIEIVVLTHPHADHLIGINQVLNRYSVGKIYFNGVVYTSNGYLEFLAKVKEKNIETVVPAIGEEIVPFADAKLIFLYPGEKYRNQTEGNLNDTTEVTRFCHFSECVVFLGDLETSGQAEMFTELNTRGIDYRANILKIAHHGGSNGTNQAIIDKIKPQTAIISVGAENKFGHPHKSVIDLLNLANIKTLRTDRDGRVELLL